MSETEGIRRKALELLSSGEWGEASARLAESKNLLPVLRSCRQFELLRDLADRVVRSCPDDVASRRLLAQALIETGLASSAIAVSYAGLRGLDPLDPEWSELHGLIGRAYKQMVMDRKGAVDFERQAWLRKSLSAYAMAFRRDSGNSWHGVNLLALIEFAERSGTVLPATFDRQAIAESVIAGVHGLPAHKRDQWSQASLVEAYLALGSITDAERHLRAYLEHPKVVAFDVASTLRQFSEVWGLEGSPDERVRGIVQTLRARLMTLPGGQVTISRDQVVDILKQPDPSTAQLQAILGVDGTMSYDWWKRGLQCAESVAAIHGGIGARKGTGFVIKSSDIGWDATDELLVLTNFHVVNRAGSGRALRPEDARVSFQIAAPDDTWEIESVLWESPIDRHDAALLRLRGAPPPVASLQVAGVLPVLDDDAKVYVIGHPLGGGLEFSFQDNALLDHEGPRHGRPVIDGVCRLHYRAPTEKGSSGSPVFNDCYWHVIALHHAGGEMSRLNGKPGRHAANEGISIFSIREAIHASRSLSFAAPLTQATS